MKKFLLAGTGLCMGLLLLNSCQKDQSDAAETASQVIEFKIETAGGSGTTRRSGRPLYSTEPSHKVEKVALVICDESNQVVFTANQLFSELNPSGNRASLSIPSEQRLPQGSYTIYAYGYSIDTEYKGANFNYSGTGATDESATGLSDLFDKFAPVDAEAASGKITRFNGNLPLTIVSVGEEIFGGKASLEVENSVASRAEVEIQRQVAGAFGYFVNIPVGKNGKMPAKIQLVSTKANKSVVLGHFNTSTLVNNGKNTSANVVNGYDPYAAERVLYEIVLSDWFTTVKDADGDGLVDTDSWKNPYYQEAGDPTFVKGSVFAGSFIMPFQNPGTSDAETFTVKMIDGEGSLLASWKVKNNDASATSLANWNSGTSQWDENPGYSGETAYKYSVFRNHLYGLGVKDADTNDPDGTNPDGSEDGDTTPDKPVDLLKSQTLELVVNANWEVIHNLELE